MACQKRAREVGSPLCPDDRRGTVVARVATFEDVDVEAAPEVSAWIRENALPRTRELRGFKGGLTLLDRQRRRVLAITLFESEDDVAEAQPTFEEIPSSMPDDLREKVAATRTSVDVCDVLVSDAV